MLFFVSSCHCVSLTVPVPVHSVFLSLGHPVFALVFRYAGLCFSDDPSCSSTPDHEQLAGISLAPRLCVLVSRGFRSSDFPVSGASCLPSLMLFVSVFWSRCPRVGGPVVCLRSDIVNITDISTSIHGGISDSSGCERV